MNDTFSLDSIISAHKRIKDRIIRTPVLNYKVSDHCELFLKAENLQITGSFKYRGALNKILSLPGDCRGIVADSSGNHAQAVACAAKLCGLPAAIVMPGNAPGVKRERTARYGAEIITVGDDANERAEKARQVAADRGYAFVDSHNDFLVAAGQGTAVLELLEDAAGLDYLYVPIGGGGLMTGCATACQGLSPETLVIGVEPAAAPRAMLSIEQDKIVEIPVPDTIADGLRVRSIGATIWPHFRAQVDKVVLVDEAEILNAMAFALGELKVVLEPSGACALAAALREKTGCCGVVLTGGNVDKDLLIKALDFYPNSSNRN